MKHVFISTVILFFLYSSATAQNKTLGVGVATPNTNAALHVGSPTNNQGFLMPTLTTTQRTAISLGTSDAGLMVYDTDLKSTFTWNGSAWIAAAKAFPVIDTLTNTVPGSALFRLVNTGTAAGNFGVVHFENANPNSGFSTIFGKTNSATNGVADFVINNPLNNNDGIGVITNGIGTAGRFTVSNKLGQFPAIWVETNSDQALSAAVYGLNTGKGDAAGVFRINNASNNFGAVYGETNGGGPAVKGLNIGTGNGAYFRKDGANASTAALWADNFGNDGFGGIIQNAGTSPKAALFVEAVGAGASVWANKASGESGNAIDALHDGTAGNAGLFEITQASNTDPALQATTVGSGPGVFGKNEGSANGFAGLFANDQVGNTYPAIQASTVGSGPGVRVFQDATSIGGGVDVIIQNTSNPSNGFSVDHQGTGPAITASQSNNGLALNVVNGGLRYNVTIVSSAGSVATRSAVYNVTTTGPFTLGWTAADGDVIYVFNSNGVSITFAGASISAGVLAQLIYIGGNWRTNN